jgi:hypothetical protein
MTVMTRTSTGNKGRGSSLEPRFSFGYFAGSKAFVPYNVGEVI